MPELHNYRLFISHAWKYNDEYYKLLDMLKASPNFIFSNYSVPEHDPLDANNKLKLQTQLKNQINPVEVVVILAGMYASYSDWIQFEIDHASYLSKPIVGIKPWGQERVPSSIQSVAKEIVGWNTSTIVAAIRNAYGS